MNDKRRLLKHKMFEQDVLDLEKELGRLPFLYEICEHLGGTATSNGKLLKSIMPWYPDKLMITPSLHRLMDAYEPGMTIKGLASETGVAYCTVAKMLGQLKEQGIGVSKRIMPPYERTPYQKPQSTGLFDVYMYITDGVGEGQLGKVIKITDCYYVKLNDGTVVKKEGYQLRDKVAHERLKKLGKIC